MTIHTPSRPFYLFLFCFLGSTYLGMCQNTFISDSNTSNTKKVKKLDIFDIMYRTTNKVGLTHRELSTEEDPDTIISNIFSFLPYINYSPPTSWAGGGLLSASFYTGRAKTTNLSTISLSATVTLNKQFILTGRSTLWTEDNRYNWVGDWRYLKYPSYTYGLGAKAPMQNKTLMDYSYLRIYQTCYKNILPNFYLGVGYHLDYHWNITEEGVKGPSKENLFYRRNGSKTVSSGFSLNALYDSRKNVNTPAAGSYYLSLSYRVNSTLLKSDQNWHSFILDARKYIRFPSRTQHILAFWTYNWFTPYGNPPYLDLPSTAWDTFRNQGRGYVQGRYRSSHLLSAEVEYRFTFTRNQLLGGVIFTNVQTVSELGTYNFMTYFPAAGLGLRIKINKHTNTNLALNYAMGIQGNNGFFFSLGETF